MARRILIDWVGTQLRDQMGNARVLTNDVTQKAIFVVDQADVGQLDYKSSSSSSDYYSSSSSTSSSSSESIGNTSSSSSSSSELYSSSSSSTSSSSSVSNQYSLSSSDQYSSSSSSEQDSSSSSSSMGLYNFCGFSFSTDTINGNYSKTGTAYNGYSTYYNGNYYLFNADAGAGNTQWAISAQIGDSSPQWVSSCNTLNHNEPGDDSNYVSESGLIIDGPCSTSSSSSSSGDYSSSSS